MLCRPSASRAGAAAGNRAVRAVRKAARRARELATNSARDRALPAFAEPRTLCQLPSMARHRCGWGSAAAFLSLALGCEPDTAPTKSGTTRVEPESGLVLAAAPELTLRLSSL